MSLLKTLQDKLFGNLQERQDDLVAARSTLTAEIDALQARERELNAQIAGGQAELDRVAVEEALATARRGLEAARREQERLDLARAEEQEKRKREILDHIASLDKERAQAMAVVEDLGRELGGLEKQGRLLWQKALQAIRRGFEIRNEIDRACRDLEAMGVPPEGLPEVGEMPIEGHAFYAAAPAVLEAMNACPDVSHHGHRTFLGSFFDRIGRVL